MRAWKKFSFQLCAIFHCRIAPFLCPLFPSAHPSPHQCSLCTHSNMKRYFIFNLHYLCCRHPYRTARQNIFKQAIQILSRGLNIDQKLRACMQAAQRRTQTYPASFNGIAYAVDWILARGRKIFCEIAKVTAETFIKNFAFAAAFTFHVVNVPRSDHFVGHHYYLLFASLCVWRRMFVSTTQM